jgi:acyl carrier protein
MKRANGEAAGMSEVMDADAVCAAVIEAVTELVRETGSGCVPTRETPVFGAEGALLDSMGLVNLIADLEARIEQRFGKALVLADERAMSRTRSPFRTVGAITEHVLSLAAEAS